MKKGQDLTAKEKYNESKGRHVRNIEMKQGGGACTSHRQLTMPCRKMSLTLFLRMRCRGITARTSCSICSRGDPPRMTIFGRASNHPRGSDDNSVISSCRSSPPRTKRETGVTTFSKEKVKLETAAMKLCKPIIRPKSVPPPLYIYMHSGTHANLE